MILTGVLIDLVLLLIIVLELTPDKLTSLPTKVMPHSFATSDSSSLLIALRKISKPFLVSSRPKKTSSTPFDEGRALGDDFDALVLNPLNGAQFNITLLALGRCQPFFFHPIQEILRWTDNFISHFNNRFLHEI